MYQISLIQFSNCFRFNVFTTTVCLSFSLCRLNSMAFFFSPLLFCGIKSLARFMLPYAFNAVDLIIPMFHRTNGWNVIQFDTFRTTTTLSMFGYGKRHTDDYKTPYEIHTRWAFALNWTLLVIWDIGVLMCVSVDVWVLNAAYSHSLILITTRLHLPQTARFQEHFCIVFEFRPYTDRIRSKQNPHMYVVHIDTVNALCSKCCDIGTSTTDTTRPCHCNDMRDTVSKLRTHFPHSYTRILPDLVHSSFTPFEYVSGFSNYNNNNYYNKRKHQQPGRWKHRTVVCIILNHVQYTSTRRRLNLCGMSVCVCKLCDSRFGKFMNAVYFAARFYCCMLLMPKAASNHFWCCCSCRLCVSQWNHDSQNE